MKKLKILFICTLLGLISLGGYGQNSDWRTYKKHPESKSDVSTVNNDSTRKKLTFNGNKGTVTITQDAKIDSMTNSIGRKPFINGYTVQIEVTQQKSIIRNSRYLFVRHNPDVPLDEVYDKPNTYLYGGRFYDKDSAYKFKHKIKSDFPDAIVIEKKMNLPPLR